jgi:uncharacterized SAM-binding protein YcdF (DUF218 family)
MFFILSKIFAALFLPITLFFFFLLFIFLRRLTGRTRRRCLAVWAIAWFCSTSFGSGLLMHPLENRYETPVVGKMNGADVVVVLGGLIDASTFRGGRPEFHDGADRLSVALEIYLKGRARHILISGGSGLLLQGGLREGDVLKDYLVSLGFPEEKILAERNSRNTRENAVQSLKIIREKKFKSVILVTSAFHMPRSVRCFQKVGLDVIPFPVDFKGADYSTFPESFFPSAQGIGDFATAAREVVGLVAYKLSGYI